VRHALILGLVGLVAGLLGVIANIAKPELGPLWYSIAVAVTGPPVPGWAGSCTATDNPEETQMQKIIPFLWFDGQAEEAMNFYVSIFKNAKMLSVTRYGAAGPGPKDVMSANLPARGTNSSTR